MNPNATLLATDASAEGFSVLLSTVVWSDPLLVGGDEQNKVDDGVGNRTAPTTATKESLMPQYYKPVYQGISGALVGIIFLVGLVGNIMVVYVVGRTRTMHTPVNSYLVSLAVADLLLLVTAVPPTLAELFLVVEQTAVLGAPGCQAMVFAQYLSANVSALSITAFTVERYIAICFPMRAHTMLTVRRANRIILSLWSFCIAYCVAWICLTTAKPYVSQ